MVEEVRGISYFVFSTDGNLYYRENAYGDTVELFKNVRKEDGSILENVKDVTTGSGATVGITTKMAVTNDNKLYAWGENGFGMYGDGTYTTVANPKEINPGVSGTIKNVEMSAHNSFLLMENGDVYAAGERAYGVIGDGAVTDTNPAVSDSRYSNIFYKTSISNIKELHPRDYCVYAIDNDDYLWAWGSGCRTGQGYQLNTPERVKNADGSLFDVKVKNFAEGVSGGDPSGYVFFGEDNKLYYANDGSIPLFGTANSSGPKESTFTFPGLVDATMTISRMHFSAVINGTLYMASQSNWVASSNQSTAFRPFEIVAETNYSPDLPKIIDASTRVQKAGGEKFRSFVLTTDKKLYIEQYPAKYQTEISITGKKAISGANDYVSAEKYKDKVTLWFNRGGGYTTQEMQYRVADMLNGSYGALTDVSLSAGLDVESIENQRVYKKFIASYKGVTGVESREFIVDIYNHPFDGNQVSVSNTGSTYGLGHVLVWDKTNGLEGNNVKATLQKDGGTPVLIVHGYQVDVAGSYILLLTDDYGNSSSYTFNVDSVPTVRSAKLIPTNEPLTYNSEDTVQDGTLGYLDLVYDEGEPHSAIKEVDFSTGVASDDFRIEKDTVTGKFYVKAKRDIAVGSHTFKISGENKNDTEFYFQVVTVTVSKANSPMTWNETTKAAISNGKFINESLTVGVVDNPMELGAVSFSLENAETGDSIDPVTGVLTVGPISGTNASKNITIIAKTAANANYDEKILQGTITFSKRNVALKTVIVDGVNKDNYVMQLGATLPTFAIAANGTTIDAATLTELKPDSYKIIKQGDSTETAIISITRAGTYEIRPVYNANTAVNNYTISSWAYATITANAVTIDESNATDFYTLTFADGTSYVPGNWTNQNVIITPKHNSYTNMKINSGSFQSGPQTYTTEGSNDVTLTFQTNTGIEASTSVTIKLDKVAPSVTNITYADSNTSTFASLLRTITFDKFFQKEQTATFVGNDTDSGIKNYHYTLTEITESGTAVVGTAPTSAEGDNVVLPINKNYKLDVKAIDEAGNESSDFTHYIQISDVTPTITLTATISGTSTPYVSGTWTSIPIDIVVDSPQTITKYEYSTDGTTYSLVDATTKKVTIPNTANINDKTYTFKGTSTTDVAGFNTMKIKIDKDVPTFDLSAKTADGNDYDGTETNHDVTVTLNQETPNISGVTYYYCDDSTIAQTNPIANSTAWTKVNATSVTFDQTIDTTYYFKAVSNAGLPSPTAISQAMRIEKLIENPVDLDWAIPGNEQDVTYGDSIPLTIKEGGVEVLESDIEITATGGNGCLNYDGATKKVTAISGTCPVGGELKISAKVKNYSTPLTKTISAKKVDMQLQSKFLGNNTSSKTANIVKDALVPDLSVDFVAGKSLITADATLVSKASDLGDFEAEFANANGILIPNFTTNTIGSYQVKQKLKMNSVTVITDFAKKYNVETLPATLVIGDNAIADSDLYNISGGGKITPDNEWYTDKITIEPIHQQYNKMGINGDVPTTGSQDYPSGEIVNGTADVELVFDNSFAQITKTPTFKFDNLVPDVTVTASSNGSTYNGVLTENDVTISLSQPNRNASGVVYYYCTNATTAASNPTNSGWVKVTGTTMRLDTTQNKTYYFKAISGAGLMSTTAQSQLIHIEKKEAAPDNMDWSAGIKDDLAYGDKVTLSIDNTNGNDITYDSSGGDGCLTLDKTTGTITAISGVCNNGNMEVTAQVGNYDKVLEKTSDAPPLAQTC